MNSIFLRLYGGLLLALCFIGAITYGAVELVNSYRSDLYREKMARGTFFLMAEGYQRYEAGDRDRWSQVLSKLFSAEISLKSREELALGYREKLHLEDGLVVMRLNDDEGYADILFQIPDEDAYINTRMTKVSEQQARATAVLILNHLSHFQESEWAPALADLQHQFGYPLALVQRDDVSLDGEQEQRLNRREVVIALDDSTRRDSSIRIYAPVAQTGKLLVIGPLSLFDQFPIELLLIAGATSLLAVALATYLQVSPLQRRLKQLDNAVSQLGSGDLGAYANIEGNDAIGQVAATFNGMTAHIRRLIESQREMTRAVSHELRTPVARLRFGLEMLADILIEAAHDQRSPIGEGRINPQAVEDARELHRDVAATLDHHLLRQLVEEESLVRGDDVLAAFVAQIIRPAARGHQNMFGGVVLASHSDRVRIDHRGAPVNDRDPGPLEHPSIDAVQAGDFLVFVIDKSAPVERIRFDGPAIGGRIGEILMEVGGINEELLGNTPDIDAGPAHELVFGHGHTGAICGGKPRRPDAARSRTNDK